MNIGVLITDHNVEETLCITDRAYMLFEGRILFKGRPEELAENPIVRTRYLTNSFVLRPKDFEAMERERLEEDEREAAKEAAEAAATAKDTANKEAETPETEQETDNELNTITTES